MWNLKILAATGTAFIMSLAATAWFAHSKGRESGMQEVQTLWTADRLAMSEAHVEELMKARQRERALMELSQRLAKEHKREVDRIVREYNADLERLHDRPVERAGAGGVPENPDAGVGCTGEGLSRPDSEFLVWLGGEAARTQAALNACVSAYNEVREQINAKQDTRTKTDDAGSSR